HPYHPPVRQRVADKIHRPVLARRRRPGQRLPHPRRVPFSLAATQRQPLLPIQAQHPLVVHLPPLPAQQQVQPLIPEPPPFRRQLQQALLEPRCRFRLGPVALTRSMGRDHPAGPPLTQLQLLGEQPYGRSPGIGPQNFLDSTSRSPFTSSINSATRCFSSRFSSSNCRSRFASFTSSPPNLAFQRYCVCSLAPSRRHASFGLPPASTYPMICSSVNLLLRIVRPSSWAGTHIILGPVFGEEVRVHHAASLLGRAGSWARPAEAAWQMKANGLLRSDPRSRLFSDATSEPAERGCKSFQSLIKFPTPPSPPDAAGGLAVHFDVQLGLGIGPAEAHRLHDGEGVLRPRRVGALQNFQLRGRAALAPRHVDQHRRQGCRARSGPQVKALRPRQAE